jgi:tetratricopeptide (TPR) repeat protein
MLKETLYTPPHEKLESSHKNIHDLLTNAEDYSKTDTKKSLAFSKQALLLAKKIEDTQAIKESLKYIGNAQFELGQIKDSVKTFEKAISFTNELHDELSKSIFIRLQSKSIEALGDFPVAEKLLCDALVIQESISASSEMAMTIYRQAKLYLTISDWKQGFECIERVLSILGEYPEPLLELSALNVLGEIYYEIDEPEKALEAHLKQLKIAQNINHIYVAGTLGSIGIAYGKLGNKDLALSNYQAALKVSLEQNHMGFIIASYANISGIYLQFNAYEKALEYCDQALILLKTNYDHYKEQSTLSLKGSILNSTGHFGEAIPLLKKALKLNDRGGSVNDRWGIIFEIFKSYEGLGKKTEALEYHKKYTEAKLQFIEKRSEQDLYKLESRFLSERFKIEKQLLMDEIERRVKEVTSLGLEALRKNELLLSIKKEAATLYAEGGQNRSNLHSFVKKIEDIIDAEKAQQVFEDSLSILHKPFTIQLKNRFPSLTKMELKICSLLKMNMHSHDIAGLLFTSERTIEWHRMNIRKKIGLKGKEEIAEFLG